MPSIVLLLHCSAFEARLYVGQSQRHNAWLPNRLTFRGHSRVPLPDKAEQEAIAEALSDADALIESLEQLIAKKRHLKQGAMQELLTGKKRLPGFSENGKSSRSRLARFLTRGISHAIENLDGHLVRHEE